MNINPLFLLFFLLCNYALTAPIPITPLTLNQTVTGTIPHDEGFEYYSITIPPDTKSYEYLLVFTVKEDRTGIKEGEEIFSDPDLYVSKLEKYPNSPVKSQWYSERYGSDVLSISSQFVGANDTFYIGMYCQFKCKYQMMAYLSLEIELNIGRIYTIYISKKSTLNYYITIPPNKDYDELNILATSPFLKEFKIFISKDHPSSQNTYQVMPSWAGGYMITIDKGSKEYCNNCTYHILLQGGEEEDATVQIAPYYQDSVSYIQSGYPIYDSVKERKKRCYKFKMDSAKISSNENLIIQNTLFSGHLMMYIGGWNDITKMEYYDVPNNNYTFHINGERVVLLNKTDYDYFASKDTSNDTQKYLHFCLYSSKKTSFILTTHFLSQEEEMQRYNFLLPENEINGYLKGKQVTRYRILEFKTKSNITVVHEELQGNSSMYIYFCDSSQCYMTNQVVRNHLANKQFLLSNKTFLGHEIVVQDKDNKCQNSNNNKLYCQVLVVVTCDSDDFCAYKLRVSSNESILRMIPKTTYYNLLPVGQIDNYEIIVSDESIDSVVIVLNTASGDAELIVSVVEEDTNKIIGLSLNNDYIPDVVRITAKRLNSIKSLNRTADNLVGKYRVKIASKSFSTYNLYYYTTFKHDSTTKVSFADVTIELSEGDIVLDHFPNDINYKIYSFIPGVYPMKPKEDIRIVLTKMNLPFSFRVYLSLDKFVYNPNTTSPHQDKFSGYDWVSDYNGELTISKNDPKYSIAGPYYVVVAKDALGIIDKEVSEKAIAYYYIGATTERTPFILYEGKYHSSTLTNAYSKQIYWFTHNNISEPLEINVNVYKGAVDVYISKEQITSVDTTNIERKSKMAAYKERITNYETIRIPSTYFTENCRENSFHCGVFIYVKKGLIDYDGQYMITGGAGKNNGILLTPGMVKTDSVKVGEYKHYIIEEIQKRKDSALSITFYSGDGEIYLRIPERPEVGDNIKYPTETNYQFKGEDNYMGKLITIPASYFAKLNTENIKIQLLITVKGTEGNYDYENEDEENYDDECTFIISYSSEAKRINQNVPYYSSIQAGESQYFTFYFDSDVSNIYIALTNMNGDADIFLNYGEVFPTPEQADWVSMNTNHEFLDITKNDKFFKENKISQIGGTYTLLLYGYVATTYTLYVSASDNLILPLYDNSPMTCHCAKANDKCYFRYADFYENTSDNDDEDIQIIFTSQYTYGTGMMYSKLYSDFDLFDTQKNIYDNFPSSKENDYSNVNSNQRNYMRVVVQKKNNPKYTKDSVMLLTLQCLEPSLVDINIATRKNEEYDFLDQSRENIFFLKQSEKPTQLAYYNSIPNMNLIYEVYGYLGKARIEVYSNTTEYNTETQKYEQNYHLYQMMLIGKDDTYIQYTPYQYHVIKVNETDKTKRNIYFRVTPYEDFGFYIKLSYARKWTSIPINKAKDFYVEKGTFYGYFDIQDGYTDIDVSVVLSDSVRKTATVYLKINIITKNGSVVIEGTDEETVYNYSVPSENNKDYMATTDSVLGSLLIKMSDLPKIKKHYKYVRVLMYIKVEDYEFDKDEDDENDYDYDEDDLLNTPTNASLTIIVTPTENNFKRIDASAFTYYFSNESAHSNGNETKIYHLERTNPRDDIMIIEISSCQGDYNFKITDKLTTYGNETEGIKVYDEKKNGRQFITILDLKSKHYYLSIWAKKNAQCDIFGNKCDSTNYMLYYYTTTKEGYKRSEMNSTFEYESYGRGAIKLKLPEMKDKDVQGRHRDQSNYTYNVFISTNKEEFELMESVCYLRTMNNATTNKLLKHIKMSGNNIIVKGLKSNEKYYVNILAENTKTKELITFKPMLIVTSSSIPVGIIIAFILILIFIVTVAVYFYKKYTITKKILRYETSDVRNMSEIPKSESEMATIVAQREKAKYVNLAENADKV